MIYRCAEGPILLVGLVITSTFAISDAGNVSKNALGDVYAISYGRPFRYKLYEDDPCTVIPPFASTFKRGT